MKGGWIEYPSMLCRPLDIAATFSLGIDKKKFSCVRAQGSQY
jgi:hypothetical protein